MFYDFIFKKYRRSGVTLIALLFLTALAKPCQAQWQLHDGHDRMSGDRTLSAVIVNDIEDNGRHGDLEVTAQCTLANSLIKLNFVYQSKSQPGMGFYREQPDPTIALGQIYTHKPLAQVRENFGSGPTFSSPAPSDYPNQASLSFIPEVAPDDPALALMLTPHAGGRVSDLVNASSAKFQFTLENGDRPIFEMNPQDEVFQHFASICAHKGVAVKPPQPIVGSRSSGTVYTAAEFVALLPDAMRQGAISEGLDAHIYDKELQFISNAVQTCAKITPQMATDPRSPGDAPIWYKYGKQFAICTDLAVNGVDISDRVGNPHNSSDPSQNRSYGNVILKIGQPVGQFYKEGKGFEVTVHVLGDTPLFNRVNIEQDH